MRKLRRTSAPIVHAGGTIDKPKTPFRIIAGIVAYKSSWAEATSRSGEFSFGGVAATRYRVQLEERSPWIVKSVRPTQGGVSSEIIEVPDSTTPMDLAITLSVPSACPSIGVGERPLVSKDGARITTFVDGKILVRNLFDCDGILDTGVRGAKADFSWDGRYIAFHALKPDLKGYEIRVIDTVTRTERVPFSLPGSSYFPSWTKDGSLCFRYVGDDYRGFVLADNPLAAPERRLSNDRQDSLAPARWADLFPRGPTPPSRITLLMIWAPWSAHAPVALAAMQEASAYYRSRSGEVSFVTAADFTSVQSEVTQMLSESAFRLPLLPMTANRIALTDAVNQSPTTLLFVEGVQSGRRLGAQTVPELRAWVDKYVPSLR